MVLDNPNYALLAPDMRGIFLRGLNQFDPLEPSSVNSAQANPEPKRHNDFQNDEVGQHDHPATAQPFKFVVWVEAGEGIQSNNGDQATHKTNAPFAPAITIEKNSGSETRPKNRSVYYYIRIN
jgi:hypothetical protein